MPMSPDGGYLPGQAGVWTQASGTLQPQSSIMEIRFDAHMHPILYVSIRDFGHPWPPLARHLL